MQFPVNVSSELEDFGAERSASIVIFLGENRKPRFAKVQRLEGQFGEDYG